MNENYRIDLSIDGQLDDNQIIIQCHSQTVGARVLSHLDYLTNDKKTMVVKQENDYVVVQKSEIIYAEVYEKELTIYTQSDELQTAKTLSALIEELSKETFVQVSKSSILNINMIQRVEASFSGNLVARLSDGMKVSISRRYVPHLKRRLGI